MVNKKPVLTVIIQEGERLSIDDFCTVVTTAIVRFIDEVDYGYVQAKHEIALKNWDFTGQHISVRKASEEQWWNFLLEDGMTGLVEKVPFHVIPPTPRNLLSENVRYCPEGGFNIVDEFELKPQEAEVQFPLLSVLVEKNKRDDIYAYLDQAKNVAMANLLMAKNNMEYDSWAKNNFALNVAIVDSIEILESPRITLSERRGHIGALGLWIE